MGNVQHGHIDRVASVVQIRGRAAEEGLPDLVAQSWRRCFDTYQVDPACPRPPTILTQRELTSHKEPLEAFLRIAATGIRQLHRQVADAGYVVLLADGDGVAIDWVSLPGVEGDLKRSGLYLGAIWSEAHEGTNGIGTCLATSTPITVHRAEHYRARDAGLTCTVAPIFSPDGQLLAALDISSMGSMEDRRSQLLALQLVNVSAMLIENAYFQTEMRNHWILRVCQTRDIVGVQAEGLIAVDESGRIIAVNRRAAAMGLGRPGDALVGKAVQDIFATSMPALIHQANRGGDEPLAVKLVHGGSQQRYLTTVPPVRPRQAARDPARARRTDGGTRHLSIERLAGTDPKMQENMHQAIRLVNRDVTIFIGGETGSGKEAFAQAMHAASNRAGKPFIGVNCAAIPDTLIESELFGYAEGAFTGARKAGMRGKVLQANGGTLFLDEIGDMPIQSQTRLLRVLAEKEVVPLGGEQSIPVDLHVVSASHHDIEDLVERGLFRRDLYYRLTNATIRLPALRHRTDRIDLIRHALTVEGEAADVDARITDEALAALVAYDWPGNIRQLRGALRVALALSDDGTVCLHDLPREITGSRPPTMAPPAAAVAPAPAHDGGEMAEVDLLVGCLRRNNWCVTSAAAELGISRATLHRRIKRHGIVAPNYRDAMQR